MIFFLLCNIVPTARLICGPLTPLSSSDITEEDLEIIKDRETNIRQLEVRLHIAACSTNTS